MGTKLVSHVRSAFYIGIQRTRTSFCCSRWHSDLSLPGGLPLEFSTSLLVPAKIQVSRPEPRSEHFRKGSPADKIRTKGRKELEVWKETKIVEKLGIEPRTFSMLKHAKETSYH